MGNGASTLCAHVEIKDQRAINLKDPNNGLTSNGKDERLVDNQIKGDSGTSKSGKSTKSPEAHLQPENETPDSNCLQIANSDQNDFEVCYETNQHAHDYSIHPVGDLALSQLSDDDAGIGSDFTNTLSKDGHKCQTPLGTVKLSPQWTDDASLALCPVDKDRPNPLLEATSRAGDLNANMTHNESSISLKNGTPASVVAAAAASATLSAVETTGPSVDATRNPPMATALVDGALDTENSYALISHVDTPHQGEKKIPYTITNRTHADRTSSSGSAMDAATQYSTEDSEQRNSSIMPMSPEDFVPASGESKSKLRTTVKLPGVNESAASIHQALAVKLPMHSHKVANKCQNPDEVEFCCAMDNICLSQKPLQQSTHAHPVLVDRSVCRFSCTYEASTLTVFDRLDAQTSMYVCAEGSRSDSQNIIPEIADLNTTKSLDRRDSDATGKSSITCSLPSMSSKAQRRNSNMEKALQLSKCIPLLPIRCDEISRSKEVDMTTLNDSFATESLNSTIQSQESKTNRNTKVTKKVHRSKQHPVTQPRIQIEETSSYLGIEENCATNRYSSDEAVNAVPKHSVAYVQTESNIVEDDDRFLTDAPYNVDMTREAVLRTPSLEDVQLRRSNGTRLVEDESICTTQKESTASNTLQPMTFRTVSEDARTDSSINTKEIKERGVCGLQQQQQQQVGAMQQQAFDMKSPAQTEPNPEIKHCQTNRTDLPVGVIRMLDDQPKSPPRCDPPERHSVELTDFLQVLQSTDDFEILPDDSVFTDEPSLAQLKVGTRPLAQYSPNKTDGGNRCEL